MKLILSILISTTLLSTSVSLGVTFTELPSPWVVHQRTTWFPEWSFPPLLETSSFLIAVSDVEPASENGAARIWLAEQGILPLKWKKVTLSINPGNIAERCTGKGGDEDEYTAVAETPLWTFPRGHHLPSFGYQVNKISVIAWRLFVVTVHIKCKGKDNFETESILVKVR